MTKKSPVSSTQTTASKPVITRYTLASLIAEGGTYNVGLSTLLFGKVSESTLLARGQRIDTVHILDAAPDFFGGLRAIWGGLNEGQRASVVGYTPSFDNIFAHEVGVLGQTHAGFNLSSNDSATTRASTRSVARKARTRGVLLRTQAVNGMRTFVDEDDELTLMLSKGTAETYQELEAGMIRVANLIDSHRAADPAVASALDQTGMTVAFVKRLRDAAALVGTTGQAADATAPGTRVSQRQLDLQDGRVLHLVGIIYRAFRDAHDQDPTILVPALGAMAPQFDSRARRPTNAPVTPDPEPPSSTAAPAATTPTVAAKLEATPAAIATGEAAAPIAIKATPAARESVSRRGRKTRAQKTNKAKAAKPVKAKRRKRA